MVLIKKFSESLFITFSYLQKQVFLTICRMTLYQLSSSLCGSKIVKRRLILKAGDVLSVKLEEGKPDSTRGFFQYQT